MTDGIPEATDIGTRRIRELFLKDFRSYAETRLSMGSVTFLIGRNASGKSNLLDALRFFSEIAAEPLSTVLDRRGGIAFVRRRLGGRGAPREVSASIEVEIEGRIMLYKIWLKGAAGRGFRVDAENIDYRDNREELNVHRRGSEIVDSNVHGFKPRISEDGQFLPLLGSVTPFREFVAAVSGIRVYSIDPLTLKDGQVPDEGRFLRPDGSNAASVVRAMKKVPAWETLKGFLQAAVPQIEDVEVKQEATKLSLSFRRRTDSGELVSLPGFLASDGTLRILGILLALLQRPAPALVAIEEPEANVHPGALAVLLDAIRYASQSSQLVVTTQSPDLLDANWIQPEDIRLVEWAGGSSTVSQLSPGTMEVLHRHLRTPGELMRSGALEATAS